MHRSVKSLRNTNKTQHWNTGFTVVTRLSCFYFLLYSTLYIPLHSTCIFHFILLLYSTIFYFIFCIPVLCFQEFFQCHVLKNSGSSLGSFVSVFYCLWPYRLWPSAVLSTCVCACVCQRERERDRMNECVCEGS